MFYIEFNGYKKDKEECAGLFFVGKAYACNVVDSGRNYQTEDENGNIVKFSSMFHDEFYSFSLVDIDEEKLTLRKDVRNGEMKYRMNGIDVTKSFFDEKLTEVDWLKSKGVLVFIDFEVYFE